MTFVAWLLIPLLAQAQTPPTPVGVVMSAGPGAQIIRKDSAKPAPARAGAILYAGDRLRTGARAASFLFCPGRTYQTLSAQGEALLEAGAVKLERGSVTGQKPVAACELPSELDLKRSSRQQVGGLTMRKGN